MYLRIVRKNFTVQQLITYTCDTKQAGSQCRLPRGCVMRGCVWKSSLLLPLQLQLFSQSGTKEPSHTQSLQSRKGPIFKRDTKSMARQKSLYTVQIYKKCQDNAALSFRSVNYVFKIYVRTDQRQRRMVDLKPQSRQSARLSLQSSQLPIRTKGQTLWYSIYASNPA